MARVGITIDNLAEFRRDLKAAEASAPRALAAGIRRAGKPITAAAQSYANASSITGELARGYTVRVSGTTGGLVSRVPYGAGAEWGAKGKWKGFLRYPGAPGAGGLGRFAWRATLDKADEVTAIILDELQELVELRGWAS